MKVNTIIQIVLTAEEGCFLTDGETFGKTVVLPSAEDVKKWSEITQDAYDAMVKKQEELQ